MQTAEVARSTATTAIKNKKQKDVFLLQRGSEEAAAKIKNDYIEFIKNGVLSGSIKSVLQYSGASSSTGESAEDYVETGQKSTKEFQSAFGEVQKATDIVEYPFKLREEARRVDIVPTLQNNLMSIGKMADAGYLTIFDKERFKSMICTTQHSRYQEAAYLDDGDATKLDYGEFRSSKM